MRMEVAASMEVDVQEKLEQLETNMDTCTLVLPASAGRVHGSPAEAQAAHHSFGNQDEAE